MMSSAIVSQVHYVKKYTFVQTDTFLESLEHEESENQCLHLHRFLQVQHFLISK